jgi:hypothetical protein
MNIKYHTDREVHVYDMESLLDSMPSNSMPDSVDEIAFVPSLSDNAKRFLCLVFDLPKTIQQSLRRQSGNAKISVAVQKFMKLTRRDVISIQEEIASKIMPF